MDKTSSMVFEVDRAEPVRLAVVACGPRLEETLTMLKSAVLFSHRTLHFHIFADDELHSGFRDAVSSAYISLRFLWVLDEQTDRQMSEYNKVKKKVMSGCSLVKTHVPFYVI